jgi:hypothetical protein
MRDGGNAVEIVPVQSIAAGSCSNRLLTGMAPHPVGLITEISKAFGGRVQSDNLFDFNVSQRSPVPRQSWELIAPPGEFFQHKVDIRVRGQKVRLRANDAFVMAEARSNLDVPVISINRRDRIMCLKESSLEVPVLPFLPVFASTAGNDLADFVSSPPLAEVLLALNLRDAESLHVYRNGVVAYLQPDSAQVLLSALEAICKFVEQLRQNDEPRLAVDSLPRDLGYLSPLIEQWAITDDELRTDMLEQKTPEDLREFIVIVDSCAALIEECIGSPSADSELAIALSALLECAVEARLRLEAL